MRKIIFLILSVLLILSGCASNQTTSQGSPADAYKNAAQDQINAGNIEEAMAILDEGIGLFDDDVLKQMKEDLLASQNNENEDAESSDADATVEGDLEENVEVSTENVDAEIKVEAEVETETNEAVADETVTETKTEENADYVSLASGTWFSGSSTMNISVNADNTLYVDYSSWDTYINDYVELSGVVDNRVEVKCCNYYEVDSDYMAEMIFYPDVIQINHANNGYMFEEYFERFVPTKATLDIKDYLGENHCYAEYFNGDDSATLIFEGGKLHISLNLGNKAITYAISLILPFEKGILLMPDEDNGNSITFNVEKINEGYCNNPLGKDGKVTLIFEDGKITFKLKDGSFAPDNYEGTLYKDGVDPLTFGVKAYIFNIVDTMSSQERRDVNIFLSNFCEAGFTSYGYDEPDLNQSLLNFAFLHNKINVPSRIGFDYDQVGNYYHTISSSYVDSTLNKFFGHSIPHQSYGNIQLVGDDSYHFCAADGQSHSYFSTVSYMTENGDGEYYVEFGIFYDANATGFMSHWYDYTWEEAYSNCELSLLGSAVLSEKYENGVKAYEIEKYIVYA